MSWEYQRMVLYRIADSEEVRVASPRISKLLKWRLITKKPTNGLIRETFKRMNWGIEIIHGVDQNGYASFQLTHPTKQLPKHIGRG